MRGVRPAEIDDLVRQLNEEYAAEGAPYAILSAGPGYQLALCSRSSARFATTFMAGFARPG